MSHLNIYSLNIGSFVVTFVVTFVEMKLLSSASATLLV